MPAIGQKALNKNISLNATRSAFMKQTIDLINRLERAHCIYDNYEVKKLSSCLVDIFIITDRHSGHKKEKEKKQRMNNFTYEYLVQDPIKFLITINAI